MRKDSAFFLTSRYNLLTTVFNRITIKVGSQVLTASQGGVDLQRMRSIVKQVADLRENGIEVVLVSSGAVAMGRDTLHINEKLDAVSARQVFSAVGQAKLISRYVQLFAEQGIVCGQVLTTKENLSNRRHYLNQRDCIAAMLQHDVLPIVNENDTIALTELMFTDNDELSGLVATMMECQALAILSNIDGIYTGKPGDPGVQVIAEVAPGKSVKQYIQTGKSQFGRGGMQTKAGIAGKVAKEGIDVFIANGKRDNILTDLFLSDKLPICTHFLPGESVSGVKKWVAQSSSMARGEVVVSDKAVEALRADGAKSLLLVGVIEVKGEWRKHDVIRIMDANGEEIGVGRARYDSQKTFALKGTKGNPPLIHYDYLFLN